MLYLKALGIWVITATAVGADVALFSWIRSRLGIEATCYVMLGEVAIIAYIGIVSALIERKQ